MEINPLKPKREKVINDSRRVGGKRKLLERSARHFSVGGGEHLFVRRFPRNARSSFCQEQSENENVRAISGKKLKTQPAEVFLITKC